MRTNVPGSSDFDEPDPSELEDIPEVDFSRGERGRYARLFADGFDVAIDGATAYRLRNSQTGVVVGEWAESRPLSVRKVGTDKEFSVPRVCHLEEQPAAEAAVVGPSGHIWVSFRNGSVPP